MSLDTTEAIYEEFRKATREHLMKHLRHDVDWERFRKIEEETQHRTLQENEDWHNSYDARLAEAKQIILRETHGNILQEPKPDGVRTVPDRQTLDVKADQRIRKDHQQRLAAIKQDELDHYQEFRESLQGRDRLKGYAKNEFEQVRTRSNRSRA